MIIIKNITKLSAKDITDITVRDAISNIYHTNVHEWLLDIEWNGFKIPLDGIHISGMYDDIIIMLNDVSGNQKSFTVSFLGSTFTAIWYFEIENENVKIKAAWTSIIGAAEGEEEPLDQLEKVSDTITMSRADFMNEWSKLLIKISLKQVMIVHWKDGMILKNIFILDSFKKIVA